MAASIKKLDQMEASYLSLFTGKTITRVLTRTWFIVPEVGSEASSYPMDIFSEKTGLASSGQREGKPLELSIRPLGKINRVRGYYSASTVPDNALLFRIPDLVELKVMLGEEALATHRISLYQSGQLVTAPLH